MKIVGWILSILGGIGLVGTLILRDGRKYKFDGLAGIIGMDQGYKTMVDFVLYISVSALILGIIFLIVGYLKNCHKN